MRPRIHCPVCNAGHAYSSALLGRSVGCRECRHTFTVDSPPEATLVAASLTPPPLPARGGDDETSPRRADPQRARSERDSVPQTRGSSSNLPALLGLVVVVFLGFGVIATGIGYILWPETPPAVTQPVPAAAPPEEPQQSIEKPKSLNDVLNENPSRPRKP